MRVPRWPWSAAAPGAAPRPAPGGRAGGHRGRREPSPRRVRHAHPERPGAPHPDPRPRGPLRPAGPPGHPAAGPGQLGIAALAWSQSRRAAIDSVANVSGVSRPGLALVTFFGQRANARFDPQTLTVMVRSREFRPLGIVPFSGRFTSQQLDVREQVSAIYLFEEDLPVNDSFTVAVRGAVVGRLAGQAADARPRARPGGAPRAAGQRPRYDGGPDSERRDDGARQRALNRRTTASTRALTDHRRQRRTSPQTPGRPRPASPSTARPPRGRSAPPPSPGPAACRRPAGRGIHDVAPHRPPVAHHRHQVGRGGQRRVAEPGRGDHPARPSGSAISTSQPVSPGGAPRRGSRRSRRGTPGGCRRARSTAAARSSPYPTPMPPRSSWVAALARARPGRPELDPRRPHRRPRLRQLAAGSARCRAARESPRPASAARPPGRRRRRSRARSGAPRLEHRGEIGARPRAAPAGARG